MTGCRFTGELKHRFSAAVAPCFSGLRALLRSNESHAEEGKGKERHHAERDEEHTGLCACCTRAKIGNGLTCLRVPKTW